MRKLLIGYGIFAVGLLSMELYMCHIKKQEAKEMERERNRYRDKLVELAAFEKHIMNQLEAIDNRVREATEKKS